MLVTADSPRYSGDIDMLLGKHLLHSTRDKIMHGEFIDYFSLLYPEIEKKNELLDEKEKEVLKKCKVKCTWDDWVFKFMWLSYIGSIPEGLGTIPKLGHSVESLFVLRWGVLAPV